MTRVETKGSVWLLDDDNHRYARMPKQEGPRWSPHGEDWGGPGAGALEDLTWHEMTRWEIQDRPITTPIWDWVDDHHRLALVETGTSQPILVITLPDNEDSVVVASDAEVVS